MLFHIRKLVLLLLLRRRRRRRRLLETHNHRTPAKKRRFWVREFLKKRKQQGQYHTLVQELANNDREYYFRYMRMSPERFDHLLTLVTPHLRKKRCRSRETITPAERLAVCLRYLATGDSQQSQSFNFRIGRSTVCSIVKEVCAALWKCLSPIYVKMPESINDWRAIAEDYEKEWDFPNVIGAVDGKHIAIECPKFGGSLYYNYKNFHSLVLMAICDSAYRFTYVDIGSYGSENDATIFRRTQLFQDFVTQVVPVPHPRMVGNTLLPYTLLGDEIFPLNNWLMKPFPGRNRSHRQDVYNYRLSRSRRTIENAFGVLSARWRIFRRPIRANVDTVEHIIEATIALHNYLLLTENGGYVPAGFVDCFSSSGELISGRWREEVLNDTPALRVLNRQGSANYRFTAKETRERFCELVNSPAFSLDYQDTLVRSCGVVLS